MPWARIDDSLYDHPKLDRLGRDRLAGVGLLTLCLSWSNRFLTDGIIPADRIVRLGGSVRLADRLCEAGILEHVDGGYHIHDFHAYSKSRARVLAERESGRDRQAQFRSRNAVSNEELTPKSQMPRPVPVTRTHTTVRESVPEAGIDVARRVLREAGIEP